MKKLILLFLLLLIPITQAIETSSGTYQAKIIISPASSLSSASYKSRVIVGEFAVKNITSANYKMWVGFIFPGVEEPLPGGTIGSPVTEMCGENYYMKDGICVKKRVFIRVIETIKVNFIIWFLLGVITALFVNYKYYKKREKKDEKNPID